MRLAWVEPPRRWALESVSAGRALGVSVPGEQRSKDVALHGDAGVARRFGVGVAQDSVSFGIHDDPGVRAMAGQGHTESAEVSGEGRRFAVAGERMNDDDRFALQALRLVRSGNENSW